MTAADRLIIGEVLHSRIKAVLERVLTAARVPGILRAVRPGTVTVLAYHNVLPDGEPVGDPSLHLPLGSFCAQLDRLVATHDVVPLESILAPPGPGSTRPRAAITFDDAYRGAVLYGVPELERRALPATVFVAPGRLEEEFWWDGVAVDEALADEWRTEVLETLAGEEARARACARERGHRSRLVSTLARAASEAELRAAMARHPLLTLGSHSWSHPNLARLGRAELELELAQPLDWLRERFDRVLPWIAYPYGRSSAAVARAAEQAGYHGGLMVTGGAFRHVSDRFAVPRINIPAGVTLAGFELRAGGLIRT